MTMKKLFLSAAAALALSVGAASAATLTLVGGTVVSGPLPNYNPSPSVPLELPLTDVRSTTDGGAVNGGLYLGLGAGESATITYTIAGQESGYFNYLNADGTLVGENQIGASAMTTQLTSGYLSFGFQSNGYNPARSILNGGLSDDKDLYIGFGTIAETSPQTWTLYSYFGDGTGDLDHDDLVVRIDVAAVAAVPVPASALLLGTALAGIGALRRRLKG